MSYIKKRVPRKPGMTPQEIIADQRTLTNWITENINLIIYASGGILLILIVILGITWMKGEKRAAANSALSTGMAMYKATTAQLPDGSETDKEKLEEALVALEEVANEYSNAPQGHSAAIFKANVLFRLGRYQEAASTIEDLKSRARSFVNEINGFYLLARSYEAMGDFKSAIDAYQSARGRAQGDMRAVIEIDLARCHELSGDRDAAIALFREIADSYPDTIFATRAGKKLATLGVTDQEKL